MSLSYAFYTTVHFTFLSPNADIVNQKNHLIKFALPLYDISCTWNMSIWFENKTRKIPCNDFPCIRIIVNSYHCTLKNLFLTEKWVPSAYQTIISIDAINFWSKSCMVQVLILGKAHEDRLFKIKLKWFFLVFSTLVE